MYRSRIVLLSALFAILLLPRPGGAQESTYGVTAGDRVIIGFYTAAGDEILEITGERTVDGEGNLFLPYVGTVSVEGMDAPALRRRLAQLYQDYYDQPVVDVEVRLRVSVTGTVQRPGTFFLDPTSTLLQAVAEAGGEQQVGGGYYAREVADLGRVRLVRGDETEVLNLRADASGADRAFNRLIRSGDWLYVPRASTARTFRENVTFWGQVASLALTVALFVTQVGN